MQEWDLLHQLRRHVLLQLVQQELPAQSSIQLRCREYSVQCHQASQTESCRVTDRMHSDETEPGSPTKWLLPCASFFLQNGVQCPIPNENGKATCNNGVCSVQCYGNTVYNKDKNTCECQYTQNVCGFFGGRCEDPPNGQGFCYFGVCQIKCNRGYVQDSHSNTCVKQGGSTNSCPIKNRWGQIIGVSRGLFSKFTRCSGTSRCTDLLPRPFSPVRGLQRQILWILEWRRQLWQQRLCVHLQRRLRVQPVPLELFQLERRRLIEQRQLHRDHREQRLLWSQWKEVCRSQQWLRVVQERRVRVHLQR